MNHARILEFGPPKTGKTKNMAETAPGPVCLMNFDRAGWESITARPIRLMTSTEFRAKLLDRSSVWPEDEVTVLDYSIAAREIGLSEKAQMVVDPISSFIQDFNAIFRNCPFKLTMVDPITMWDTAVNSFIGGKNNADTLQIQHWGQAAVKKLEIINCVNSLPCHTAFIAHEEYVSDKLSGETTILPLSSGKVQAQLCMLFSQVVYSQVNSDGRGGLKYQLRTQPFGLVKGIGLRWPQNRPATVDNNWKGIFGEQS